MFGKENKKPPVVQVQTKVEDQEMKTDQQPTFLGILNNVFNQMVEMNIEES